MAFEPAQQHQAAAPLQGPLFEGLLAEFAASAISAGIGALGAPNRVLIFAAAARACGPFDYGPGRSYPVSVNALAASLAAVWRFSTRILGHHPVGPHRSATPSRALG